VLKKVSGTTWERVVREAFKDLLTSMGRAHDLVFVAEYEIESKTKERRCGRRARIDSPIHRVAHQEYREGREPESSKSRSIREIFLKWCVFHACHRAYVGATIRFAARPASWPRP